jgi:L-cysteine/cystine lyase
VHELGVDYYAFPGQKWLCGPEGTGGLYVRRTRHAHLQATFVGTRSAGPAATHYEWGTLFRPGVHGLHAALGWLDELGPRAIFGRTREMADYCYQRLAALDRIRMLTPVDARAGLVNVQLPGVDLDACVAQLGDHGITIRAVPDTDALRVSCAFFNTTAEIDRLVRFIATAP